LMAFRVALVTLLLVATAIAEAVAPVDAPLNPIARILFGVIIATYGTTIVFAFILRRAERFARIAGAQLAADLVIATIVLHLTGGAESGFVFMYLLIIGSTVLLGQGAAVTSVGAIVLYVTVAVAGWTGALPTFAGSPVSEVTLRALLRVLAINVVAMGGTGALAARLIVELQSAGERIATQGMRLRDLAALHEDVIRCLTSGLVTVSREGEIITFNAAAEEITGLLAHEVIDRPVASVFPPLVPLLESVADAGSLRRGEVVLARPDGTERIIGVSLSPLVNAEGQVLGRIVNFQDLTDLRRMEGAVVRAQRLAAVGRLAAGVAHEIRNPLAAISGSVELLAQTTKGSDTKETAALTDIVLREVERLNTLITGLLDFAKQRHLETQRLDCAALLEETVRVFQNDKNVRTRVRFEAPAPVWVEADAGQLRQVVWNLLRNADEASPEGAPLDVIAKTTRVRDVEWAEIVIRDHGAGIPAEHLPRVFEPFFSLKQGGTGLGLATVHRIIEEHKGHTEISLPEGGGTQVTVRLPQTNSGADPSARAPA